MAVLDMGAGPRAPGHDSTSPQPAMRAGTFVNAAGAVVSLALIAGIGVWGYKLLVRDVTGVPVVEAIDGPMREAPENPGGTIANNQGLAVNAVAAASTDEVLEQVLLAPRDVGLTVDDQPSDVIIEEARATEARDPLAGNLEVAITIALEEEVTPRAPLTTDDVAALVEQITAGADPLTTLDAVEVVAPVTQLSSNDTAPTAANPNIISASVPGVTRSPRPNVRPAGDLRATAVRAAQPAVGNTAGAAATPAIEASVIPAGTRLVQLGAFDSAEVANAEWTRLNGQFSEYLGGKTRVVQQAQSGGRTFFRLRAMGFDDLSDARRFCSALVAENAACIPVVVR